MMDMTVRTRFAPSPTGDLHIGGARTALFCWLYARHHGGEFILRVEDTDRERSTDAAHKAILDGMNWLRLDWDEGPYYQTERMDLYKVQVEKLLDEDKAYHCYCSREELETMRNEQRARGENPRYDGRCRDRREPRPGVAPVVRFKNPLHGDVLLDDRILGEIRVANAQLDDLIIARSDGTPTYNFTVVVDDMEMQITHVIRGNDHVNNTPRQINLFDALGGARPVFAHVPMIHGADGRKLSKRHGSVSVMQFHEDGYLSDALVNYLARLGWSHGDQEIFSRDELVEMFDICDVNKGASVFDPEKLGWLNQHYIKEAGTQELTAGLREQLVRLAGEFETGPRLDDVVDVQRDRARTMVEMAQKSLFAFHEFDAYDEKAANKHLKAAAGPLLASLRARLAALDAWTAPLLDSAVRDSAEASEVKLGALAQPLRVALTGGAASPPIDQTLLLVGRSRALARIDRALGHLR
ncbi:MAG: glutamyl-tRNA synthetase [Gammaproteobacteria bacterium]|jgi:glutamyl-tRNA synthetase